MADNRKWSDFLDVERIVQTGIFHLHRNYLNEKFEYQYPVRAYSDRKFSDSDNVSTLNPMYLDETLPIAQGVTAYFGGKLFTNGCLKDHLEGKVHFRSLEFYEQYFQYVIKYEVIRNNKLPLPLSMEKVEQDFIKIHLKNETDRLIKSEKYFAEFRNEDEKDLLLEIRDFVEGYILWVKAKMKRSNVVSLREFCTDPEAYEVLRQWFVDANLVNAKTFVWKETRALLASYLKDLHPKGYTSELSEAQIELIAERDFGLEISRRTITGASPDNIMKPLRILPPYRI